jgi:hypothetical protein
MKDLRLKEQRRKEGLQKYQPELDLPLVSYALSSDIVIETRSRVHCMTSLVKKVYRLELQDR